MKRISRRGFVVALSLLTVATALMSWRLHEERQQQQHAQEAVKRTFSGGPVKIGMTEDQVSEVMGLAYKDKGWVLEDRSTGWVEVHVVPLNRSNNCFLLLEYDHNYQKDDDFNGTAHLNPTTGYYYQCVLRSIRVSTTPN